MMQHLKCIMLVVLALLIVLFGNSVRVWHFCCDLCRDSSFEIILEGNCAPIHHSCGDADAHFPDFASFPEVVSLSAGNPANAPSEQHEGCKSVDKTTENQPLDNTTCTVDAHQEPGCYSESIGIPFENMFQTVKLLPVQQVVQLLIKPLMISGYSRTNPASFAPLIAARSSGRQLLSLHCILRR